MARASHSVVRVFVHQILTSQRAARGGGWEVEAGMAVAGSGRLRPRRTGADRRRRRGPVTMLLMEFGDYAMMRRMLCGIEERVEAVE
jgi:hypothetical protein